MRWPLLMNHGLSCCSAWSLDREVVPGFGCVVRWPRVNFWPSVFMQCWRWSVSFRPEYRRMLVEV